MELVKHKTGSEEQAEVMARIQEWTGLAESGCSVALEQMAKNEDFNDGHQWDDAVKARMEAEGRYVAEINQCRPQVNQLVGQVVTNPKDIQAVNTHGGMRQVAELKSAILKHALDSNDGMNKMAQWFRSGVITSRGFMAWFKEYHRDPLNGDLTVKQLKEDDCLWDPTCRTYDLNGTCGTGDAARYFIWQDWVDRDWAEAKWPSVKDLLPHQPLSVNSRFNALTTMLYGVIDRFRSNRRASRDDEQLGDYAATRYHMQHTWWTEYKTGWYWYDSRKSVMEPVILLKRKDISKAKAATEAHPEIFAMKKSLVKVMHHTKSIGDVFLEDVVDEHNLAQYNMTMFPVVAFYPSHRWGKAAGVVDDMIGPQETFNWLRSSVINLLKLLPNSGWVIGADVDGYADELRRKSGQAAVVIDRSKCGGHIEKVQPSPFPAGLDLISDKAKQEVREVSNIRTEAPEQDTQEMSGRAILAKQAGAQTGVSPVMANFDWSMRIFGNVGLAIITCDEVYSDDEIFAMVEESKLVDEDLLWEARYTVTKALGLELPDEPVPPNPSYLTNATPDIVADLGMVYVEQKQVFEALMQQIDAVARPMAISALLDAARNPIAGRYHTTVSLSQYSVTARMSQMVNMLETSQVLRESGYDPVSEKAIYEASDLPNKETLMREKGLI